MADKYIDDLSTASVIGNNDMFVLQQNGQAKKLPGSALWDYLRSACGAPLTASTESKMTDTTRIYVYTGSESGYVNGNWYFYNGSSWVSGGVYNSSAIDVDTAPVANSLKPIASGAVYDLKTQASLKSSITLFKRIGIIGDSYCCGEQYYSGAHHDLYDLSWGKMIERESGVNVSLYAKGGQSLSDFLDSSYTYYNSYGYGKLQSDFSDGYNRVGLFIFALGLNDSYPDTTGSGVSTYASNLATLIDNINTLYSNQAKIVLLTFKRLRTTKPYDAQYNEAIISTGVAKGVPVIDIRNLDYFKSDAYVTQYDSSSHPTPDNYAGMALAIKDAIEHIMSDNPYFSDYRYLSATTDFDRCKWVGKFDSSTDITTQIDACGDRGFYYGYIEAPSTSYFPTATSGVVCVCSYSSGQKHVYYIPNGGGDAIFELWKSSTWRTWSRLPSRAELDALNSGVGKYSKMLISTSMKATHTLNLPNASAHFLIVYGEALSTYAVMFAGVTSGGSVGNNIISQDTGYTTITSSTNKITITYQASRNIHVCDICVFGDFCTLS